MLKLSTSVVFSSKDGGVCPTSKLANPRIVCVKRNKDLNALPMRQKWESTTSHTPGDARVRPWILRFLVPLRLLRLSVVILQPYVVIYGCTF